MEGLQCGAACLWVPTKLSAQVRLKLAAGLVFDTCDRQAMSRGQFGGGSCFAPSLEDTAQLYACPRVACRCLAVLTESTASCDTGGISIICVEQ